MPETSILLFLIPFSRPTLFGTPVISRATKDSGIYTQDYVGTLINRSKYPLESGSEIGVYLQKNRIKY
jgi:hypothetical protein